MLAHLGLWRASTSFIAVRRRGRRRAIRSIVIERFNFLAHADFVDPVQLLLEFGFGFVKSPNSRRFLHENDYAPRPCDAGRTAMRGRVPDCRETPARLPAQEIVARRAAVIGGSAVSRPGSPRQVETPDDSRLQRYASRAGQWRLLRVLALCTGRGCAFEIKRNVPVTIVVRIETELRGGRPMMISGIVGCVFWGECNLDSRATLRRTIEILYRPTADGVVAGGILLVTEVIKR